MIHDLHSPLQTVLWYRESKDSPHYSKIVLHNRAVFNSAAEAEPLGDPRGGNCQPRGFEGDVSPVGGACEGAGPLRRSR